MSTDLRDHDSKPRQTASREVFLSKLFIRATTVVFLAICGVATAIALGYTPFLNR
jgi:hypothetical protein